MITSRQIIKSFSELTGKIPDNMLEDYMGLKSDVDSIISGISPQFGEGSPEGVVTSNLSNTYYDIAGSTAIMYVNPIANTNTGWRLV